MSVYRMIRKGIEFDSVAAFAAAEDAKQYSNATGIIEVMRFSIAKYDHMVAEEPYEFAITDERSELVDFLEKKALRHIKDDPRAIKRVDEAVAAHRRANEVSLRNFEAAKTPRFY